MKKLSYTKQIVVFVLILSVGLVVNSQAATTAEAAPAQTMLESKIAFIASSQVGVVETSPDRVAGKGYAQFGGPWCADFVTWVLLSSGINPFASGRGALQGSYRVARAWAYYGAAGGGYGRWGTARDAMPGDLLIDSYNGSPTAGGHISIVVESQVGGNRDIVRTVGGNESNGVRSQLKSLGSSGRYLVTLAELRNQHIPMSGGGTVVTTRNWSGFGAISTIHSIWDTQTGRVYSGTGLGSAPYLIRGRNVFSGKYEYFRPNQSIATEVYRNVVLFRTNGISSMVQVSTLTHN
jgi:hypothetical protein